MIVIPTTRLRPEPHLRENQDVIRNCPAIATTPETTNSEVTKAVSERSSPTTTAACSGSAR